MTTDTETTARPSFLGIPIDGDIVRRDKRAEQRPIEELQPIITAILDDPTVVEFGWRQYTPYFNDGEPCEFGVHGCWARLDNDPADLDEWRMDLDSSSGDDRIGKRPILDWTGEWPNRHAVYGDYVGPDEARYDRLKSLNKAIVGGEFEDVLLDTFGDHAVITVRRDGIQIEFYEHD